MNAKELDNLIEHVSGSRERFARLFGVSERQVFRWLAGDSKMPTTAVVLLRLLDDGTITRADIRRVKR